MNVHCTNVVEIRLFGGYIQELFLVLTVMKFMVDDASTYSFIN